MRCRSAKAEDAPARGRHTRRTCGSHLVKDGRQAHEAPDGPVHLGGHVVGVYVLLKYAIITTTPLIGVWAPREYESVEFAGPRLLVESGTATYVHAESHHQGDVRMNVPGSAGALTSLFDEINR